MSSQATQLNSDDDYELHASPRKIKDQVHDLSELVDFSFILQALTRPTFQLKPMIGCASSSTRMFISAW